MKSEDILNSLLNIAKNKNCHIYKARLNTKIRAFTLKDNTNYRIVLNSAIKSNLGALIHELLHIYRNDFILGADISEIEQKTHKFAKYLRKNAKSDIKREFFKLIAKCDFI